MSQLRLEHIIFENCQMQSTRCAGGRREEGGANCFILSNEAVGKGKL